MRNFNFSFTAAAVAALLAMGCDMPTQPVPASGPELLTSQMTALTSPAWPQIDGGLEHNCMVWITGEVICWGDNRSGQSAPPAGTDFVQVAAGDAHSCAVRTDGSALCWGSTGNGRSTPPSGVSFSRVSAGGSHSCGIKSDGSLACWGANGAGQTNAPAGNTYVQVSSGIQHNCALRSDGTLACWGANLYGQRNAPAGNQWVQVDVAGNHSCAVSSDGTISCWGNNSFGQTNVVANNDYRLVAAGGRHTCAVRADGSVVCWGESSKGQHAAPQGVQFDRISAGGFHNCGVQTDNSLACWGYNSFGQAIAPSNLPEPDAPADETPPVITYSISGTLGQNGWYVADVALEWSVTDDESGIASTSGCEPTYIFTDMGLTGFICEATNNAGLSASASTSLKRDATAPVVKFTGNAGTYTLIDRIVIACDTWDETSGVASHTCENIDAPATEFGLGEHTITATAVDNAGNEVTATTSFTVIAPARTGFAALRDMTTELVSQPGVRSSLLAKVDAAEAAAEAGDITERDSQLRAYISEVQAQAGKSITLLSAQKLISAARALMSDSATEKGRIASILERFGLK